MQLEQGFDKSCAKPHQDANQINQVLGGGAGLRIKQQARSLILADLTADLGNHLVGMTLLDVLVFRGDTPVYSMLLMGLVNQLPAILFSWLAGARIDRIGPIAWLTRVNISKCLLILSLIWVVNRWPLFLFYLGFVLASTFFAIGRLALVPAVIPQQHLLAFNALNERVVLIGAVIAPWLMAKMVETCGSQTALALAIVFFLLSNQFLSRIEIQTRFVVPAQSNRNVHPNRLRFAERYSALFRNNHSLRICFFLFGFVLIGGGVFNFCLPLIAKTQVEINIAQWGLMMGAYQAGAIVAGFFLSRAVKAFGRIRLVKTVYLLAGLAMVLFICATGKWQMVILMVVAGMALTSLHIVWESAIQQASPAGLRGRVMSLLSAFKGLCLLAGIITSAVLSVWINFETALAMGAAVFMAAFLWIGCVHPATAFNS